LEKGIADPINYPDMLETDEYDNRSFHVAILEEGNIIAYGRLVLPCERYPIEKTNVLPECFDRETTVETSRAFVVKERRHSDVMWHLFNGGYNFCRANGFKHMLSFSNAIMYNGYRKRHVPFDYVGEPVYFHGHKSYPLVIRVEEESYDFTQKQQFAFA
jgi:N-acyl-L-homoserine lactone synthetase